jgi:hypothetical protein
MGIPEGERPLGRPTCRWEHKIKKDLRDIGFIWFRIETVAGCCEHSNEPSSLIQFWEILE